GHTDATPFSRSYPCRGKDGKEVQGPSGRPIVTNADLGRERAAGVARILAAQCSGIVIDPPEGVEHTVSSCGPSIPSCEADRKVEIEIRSLGTVLDEKCEAKVK